MLQTFSASPRTFEVDDWIGLVVVTTIVGLWFVSLLGFLFIPIVSFNFFSLILAILCRAYLHTGLFILAHDAMHGNLIPNHRRLNNFIGRSAVVIYGFLPYNLCHSNHVKHHRYTSQSDDPDFHGSNSHPVFWFFKFIREYFPLRSLIIFMINMSVIFWGLMLVFHVSMVNLICFWILPLVLSSLQLFYFGTYLPHRQVHGNRNFLPRPTSNSLTILWSFLSCYNFGHYHWEHHEYPKTPWYRLHNIHRIDYSALH
jgi:beta-carotene ketolase (CrtW type)